MAFSPHHTPALDALVEHQPACGVPFDFDRFFNEQHQVFVQFKAWLQQIFPQAREAASQLAALPPMKVYALSPLLAISHGQLAEMIAEFMGLAHLPTLTFDDLATEGFSRPFAARNFIVALKCGEQDQVIALSNPFDMLLLDHVKQQMGAQTLHLVLCDPDTILAALNPDVQTSSVEDVISITSETASEFEFTLEELEQSPARQIVNKIITAAVQEHASDIHIEPKDQVTVVRFRISGDLRDMFSLKKHAGVLLISRLKAIADMDIAERRKPQDGATEASINGRRYILRLATTSTPYGESLIMRVLDLDARVTPLDGLGMSPVQLKAVNGLVSRHGGLILIVGPTGSGKTTTIYSMLNTLDSSARSVVSVEDPIEYRMAFANQQQVNARAGLTFRRAAQIRGAPGPRRAVHRRGTR